MPTDRTVTIDLKERLQAALADKLEIERELGGGGMSHVFLARDPSLGRQVVLKVLPPELAMGVNADRFQREIRLAAQLQHPHIVPLLSAGEAAGLPYFTMPFVKGESLREPLRRGHRFEVREVVGLLQDVAKALAHAHEHGVVHRDIKPDNVLVSGGAAVVTDFGVAKALHSARAEEREADANGALTMVGMSLGTPAYMAPEQGAADPGTDHRADIYAWGVMAYELLAGAPPFAGRSLQSLLVAHLTQAPEPLELRRPDLPPALSELVMRCLAKDPSMRPQDAMEIVRALDDVPVSGAFPTGAVAAATPGAAPRTRRAGLLAAAGIAAVVLVGAAAIFATRRTPLDAAAIDAERVVVAPFDNETGDASLASVGSMAADWLTQGLAQTGLVKVVDAKTAMSSDAMAAGARGASRLAAIASATGANRIVTGSYYKLGDSLRFQARIVEARSGDIVVTLDPVVGPAASPTATIELLRQKLLGAMAVRYNPALRSWAASSKRPPTYEAYQAFVEAMQLMTKGGATVQQRRALLEKAVRLDSTYTQAWLWLVNAYANEGRVQQADSIMERLKKDRALLSPFEAALLDFSWAMLHEGGDARLPAARALSSSAPGSEWRVVLVETLLSANRPREALDTLAHMDPNQGMLKGSPVIWTSRVSAYHELGDGKRMLAAVDELERKAPNYGYLGPLRAFADAVAGRWDDVGRRADDLLRQPRTPTFTPRNALRDLAEETRWHGNPALAKTLLEKVLATYSAEPESLALRPYKMGRAVTLVQLERFAEAKPLFEELAARDTSRGLIALQMYLGVIAARLGDRAGAQRYEQLIADRKDPYLRGASTLRRAQIAAELGDGDRAIQLVRQALAQGNVTPASLHATQSFLSLRGKPGFDELERPRG